MTAVCPRYGVRSCNLGPCPTPRQPGLRRALRLPRPLARGPASGRRRSLAEYLRRFPGHEEHVAREFLALDREPDGAAPDGAHRRQPGPIASGTTGCIEQLGRGGQGTVFLAEDVRLRRHVAIKILDGGPRRPSGDEARAPQARGGGAVAARPPAAVRGLRRRPRRRTGPTSRCATSRARRSAQRIERARGATGPSAARAAPRPDAADGGRDRRRRAVHRAGRAGRSTSRTRPGIIHRDLKPGNIMIDRAVRAGRPRLRARARPRRRTAPRSRCPGDAFGTLVVHVARAALGRARARPADRRLLARRHPLRVPDAPAARRGRDPRVAAQGASSRACGRIRSILNRALPRDLAVVLACALDVDRSRRYATALAFAEDLRRVREHEPILARPAGWWIADAPLGRASSGGVRRRARDVHAARRRSRS